MQRSSPPSGWYAALVFALGLIVALPGLARQVVPPTPPTVGSPNVATADPAVPRPNTRPCVVTLYTNQQFADFDDHPFTYTPPAGCPGPWAKVVLEADFSVTPGVQFDRTAQIAIGHTNIYYGTTAEPSGNFGPSWHIERDLTDYSALFTTAQDGDVNLGNLVNSTYTSVLYGNATLQFYPLARGQAAPRTADVVLPLSDDAGGAATLADTASILAPSLSLPTNIENAYLDLITQSQSDDEFWYTCVPNDVAKELEECGNTAFREAEITVDGTPAGVAPVYPWIYSGGLDPVLWRPIPGVQTLNFIPYRVDLTPFAGKLNDGNPHQVGVSVYNADSYFLVAASLLLYLDHGATHVTGAVTANSLAAVTPPVIKEALNTAADGTLSGSISTSARRSFSIVGWVQTSHGRVTTTLQQQMTFRNVQRFLGTSAVFVQNIAQDTEVAASTVTKQGRTTTTATRTFSYPLTANISDAFNADGSGAQTTFINQSWHTTASPASDPSSATVTNTVQSKDTLLFNSSFVITGFQNAHSSQSYLALDSDGDCAFSRTLTTANRLLTSVSNAVGCGSTP
jgi:hypothetical protein